MAAFSSCLTERRRLALHQDLSKIHFDSDAPRISLCIADVRIDLLTHSREFQLQTETYFHHYLEPEKHGEKKEPPLGEIFIQPLASTWLWEDEDPEFSLHQNSVLQRDFSAQRVTPTSLKDPERAVALVAPNLSDSIHNLLRWFFPQFLLKHNAFLMHGAGVIKNNKGYVFFGPSGAGKSTSVSLIAKCDPKATLVGDDAVIIRLVGKELTPTLYAAPLGCGYSHDAPPPIAAPLAGLYRLKQAEYNRIENILPSEGMSCLLGSAMADQFEDADLKFDLAGTFAKMKNGIQRLHFKPDADFWPEVLANSNS